MKIAYIGNKPSGPNKDWRRCRICTNEINRAADLRRREARKGLI